MAKKKVYKDQIIEDLGKRERYTAPQSEYDFYQNLGMPNPRQVSYVSRDVIEQPDELTSAVIDEQRWISTRDRLGRLSLGLFGPEEEKQGIDLFQEPRTDEDGVVRTYSMMKDKEGKMVNLGLVDGIEGVKLEDIISGVKDNPYLTQFYRDKLFGKMIQDTDPVTGKVYADTSKAFLENSIMNSMTAQLGILGAKVFGEKSIGKYGTYDPILNKLDFTEDGDVTYDGTKLNLGGELEDVADWFGKRVTYKSSGFVDSFLNTGLTFLVDAPLFYVSGVGAGKLMSKIIPAGATGTLPTTYLRHLGQNFAMLNMASAPGMISHTIDGGVDAFLEDIKHTAEFAFLAGSFSTIGEGLGLGVSKLMQKASPLSTQNIASFIKKNPNISKNLIGGFTSGALGYTTAGGEEHERIATGMVFAAMHFSSPQGWKNYVKGEKKNVMVEKDDFKSVEALMRTGKSFDEALYLVKATEGKYYEREGNNLYEIEGNGFVNKGEINRLSDVPIILDKKNAKNYNYITESIPFAKKTIKQALGEERIDRLRDKVLADGFKDVVNPYDKITEKDNYENFEYNKNLTATKMATVLYGMELYKTISKNGLPKDIKLNDLITTSAEGLDMPRRVYEQMLGDFLPAYIADPKGFKALLKEEGGSLSFLPEEYRKSFESALDATQQSLKRYANGRMMELLENREQRAKLLGLGQIKEIIKLNSERTNKDGEKVKNEFSDNWLVSEEKYGKALDKLKEAKEIVDIYDAVEQAGYSAKIFDDVQKKVKAETTPQEEFNEKVQGAKESDINKRLDSEAGRELIKKEFPRGEVIARTLLTDKEISEIGRTGAIDPETRKAMQELDEGLASGRIPFPEEFLPTEQKPVVELPPETTYGVDVKEPRTVSFSDKSAMAGEKGVVKDYFRDESGKKTGYVVETADGKKYAASPDQVRFDEPKVTDQTEYDAKTAELVRTDYGEAGVKANEPFIPVALTFWDRVKQKLYGSDAPTSIYSKRASKIGSEEEYETHRRSISEMTRAIRETLKEVENPETRELSKYFEEFDHIWAIADKMPEVTALLYRNTVERTIGEQYNLYDSVSLNLHSLEKNLPQMRETLGHEIIHALLSGSYRSKEGRATRSMELGVQADLTKLRAHLLKVFRAQEKKGFQFTDRLYERLEYALDPAREGKEQELPAVAFTVPEVAQWLHRISARDFNMLRQEKGSVLQWLRDKMLSLIGAEKSLEKSAYDELTEIVNNKFVDWGIVDIKTPYQEGMRFHPKDFEYSTLENKVPKTAQINPIVPKIEPSEQLLNRSVEQISKNGNNILPKNNEGVKSNLETNLSREKESKLDLREEPKVKLDTKEPESKSRKVEKEEVIKPRAEIVMEREKLEKQFLDTSKLQNGNKAETVLQQGEKAFDYVIRNTRLYDLSRKVKDYLYQSVVPVFRKDFSPRFESDAYKPGEEMIRYAPYHFNSIIKRHDGWAGGERARRFFDSDPTTGEARSQEGKDFLKAFKDYEYAQYHNKLGKELTWDQFKDWAGFNDSQRKMLDVYRESLKAGIDKMKEMKIKYLAELDPNIHTYASESEKSLERYGLGGLEPEVLQERVMSNPELRKKIATDIIESAYKDWDKYAYYNSIRPVTKNTVIVEMNRKSMTRVNKEGVFQPDVERTYFESQKEATEYVQKMIKEGWTRGEVIEIKDILGHSDQWGKLSAQQLMQLADEGNIPMNDVVIQKLMEVTKKGVDMHKIHKEYVPGMKYTAKEFEGQFERFLREAIYGSHKSYALTKINNNLTKWRGEINDAIKGISKISDKGTSPQDIQKMEEEYKYAYGYYNQLRAPERTVIDKIRGLTFSYLIGGVKPSFLFQQSTQGLQTTLHLISSELQKSGLGGFGEATKLLGDASANSVNAMLALRAQKKGLDTDQFGVEKEYIKMLEDLELMDKLKAVGISELSGISAEPDFYYSSRANRMTEGLIRLSNALGGGIEKFTRVQSAGMYYEVGKRRGLKGEELMNYVAEGLDKSMSEFGKGGRAPVFDSKSAVPNQGTIVNALKKSFLTLKTFSFYNYGLYHNLIKGKQWGALGTKAAMGLGMHGIMKFPLMAGMFMIAELFTDEEVDYTALRLADELDGKMPVPIGSFLRGGTGALFGVDMTRMMGEDSPLVTDIVANTWSPTWESKLLEITLGAPLGFSKNAITGSQEVMEVLTSQLAGDRGYSAKERQDHFNKAIKLAPLWVGNVLRSMEYDIDGVVWDGKTIVAREDLTTWDIVLKAMSFPVDRINKAYLEEKNGLDAQLGHHETVVKKAKEYMRQVRDSKNLDVKVKIQEINKAEADMKESKKEIIQLEKQKRERDRK